MSSAMGAMVTAVNVILDSKSLMAMFRVQKFGEMMRLEMDFQPAEIVIFRYWCIWACL